MGEINDLIQRCCLTIKTTGQDVNKGMGKSFRQMNFASFVTFYFKFIL